LGKAYTYLRMASSIKVSYEGEMRRFAASTYEDLQQRVAQLFEISSFLLKYQDEDGDMVTISSEWELEEALRSQGPVLKLYVEAAEDTDSEDYILVQKEMVIHAEVTAEATAEVKAVSADTNVSLQLNIPPPSFFSSASSPTPMALTPLPALQSVTRAPEPMENTPERTMVHTKRAYTEISQSREPYAHGAHKAPSYIISVPAAAANRRPAKQHARAQRSETPYLQETGVRTPYAGGKHGQEFVTPERGTVPYAATRASPQGFALAEAGRPYASPAAAPSAFTQTS